MAQLTTATVHRAYALLRVKSIDAEQRTIAGVASTPSPDRMGDVVEPLGIGFKNPLPLLLYHQANKPVGQVRFFPPTADGLEFEATLPTIGEPGTLRDRIEEAWQSLKAKLITGVSIGFLPTAEPKYDKATGGFVFPSTEVVELSLVTIPANADATIHTIKSLDSFTAAAPGRPVVSALGVASRSRSEAPMTTQEQMHSFDATRATKAARMAAIMAAAADAGVTLDAAQQKEYDNCAADVASIDGHLERLARLEAVQVTRATRITPTTDAPAAADTRGDTGRSVGPVIQVRSTLPPGIPFVRYVMANVWAKGDSMKALEYAKQWRGSSPEVELAIKAAVAPGNTTTVGWAAELAPLKPMTDEFLEYLRPATVIGKIRGFRMVPFNISIASQTGGGTYQWVGQGAPKPVGKLQTGSITLAITKCAGIIVITEELARVSTPSAEEVIRRDMRDGVAAFLDVEFTDPTKAPVAGVAPGSITNGVAPITSAGTSPLNARADVAALLSALAAANQPIAGAAVLMSETNLLALSFSTTATGDPAFPGLGPEGGTAMGVQFIGSQALGTNVVALAPSAILMADDGGLNIDVSREASVQMDSAPMNPPDATVVLTSFWQNNLIGLRAERFINWKNSRTGAVQRTVATYAPGVISLTEGNEPAPQNRTTL